MKIPPQKKQTNKQTNKTCDLCKDTGLSLTEVSWRHCFFLKVGHYEKCCLRKKGCIRQVKSKSETIVNTFKAWRLKVKVFKC